MKLIDAKLLIPAVGLFLFSCASAFGQNGANEHVKHVGAPVDWSNRHVIYTATTKQAPADVLRDPRLAHHTRTRMIATKPPKGKHETDNSPVIKIDWAVSLGTLGSVGKGVFPAKYTFDTNATVTIANCTSDFAVFPIAATPAIGGQANIVGLQNLYSGPSGLCGTGNPTFKFAYAVGTGPITTSPVLSLDGTKVAFVENSSTSSLNPTFHVLPIGTGGASAISAIDPGAHPSVVLGNSLSNTNSSPFIDYGNDVAYVGSDNGVLYKISPVFGATLANPPVVIATITIGTGALTSPVLDLAGGRVFVGGTNLYSVSSSLSLATLQTLTVGAAFTDPPTVDSTNGFVFAFNQCGNGSGGIPATGVVVQASTANLTLLSAQSVSTSSGGGCPTTTIPVHSGAFDDLYYTAPSSGHLFTCGLNLLNPGTNLNRFAFTAGGAIAAPVAFSPLNGTPSECSPVTELLNPNIAAPLSDRIFVGLSSSAIFAVDSNFVFPQSVNYAGGPSGIIIDNISTAAQASSLYFGTLGTGNCGTGNYCAVKLTQLNLN